MYVMRLLAALGGISLLLTACGSAGPPSDDTLYGPASRYLDISPVQQPDFNHPYVKGKIVVIYTRDTDPRMEIPGSYDDFAERTLDSTLVPAQPSQVGTIVWVDCKAKATGITYTDGETGDATNCTATVIDKATYAIVGEKSFDVPPPDQFWSECNQNCMATYLPDVPEGNIISWINGLPRR